MEMLLGQVMILSYPYDVEPLFYLVQLDAMEIFH